MIQTFFAECSSKGSRIANLLIGTAQQLSIAVLTFSLLIISSTTWAQDVSPLLFADAEGYYAAALQNSDSDPVEVLRSRGVGLQKTAVQALAAAASSEKDSDFPAAAAVRSPTVQLNLFPDTLLPLYVERTEPTHDGVGVVIHGFVSPDGEGQVILTVYQNAMSGSVRLANEEFYELFVSPDGDGEIKQVRFRGNVDGEDDFVVPEEDENGLVRHAVASRLRVPPSFESNSDLALFAGGTPVVDVLVAYTERVRVARGGTAGVLAYLNTVMAQSNAAFTNSQVAASFRLAHAVEVVYNDSQSNMSYNTALSNLRSPSDGLIDEVHALRDQYGADLVTLFVGHPFSGGTVGMAYLMTSNPQNFGNWAFSVVHHTYAGGTSLTFPHEAGHNMGLHHDQDNGGALGALDAYSRGYQQKTLTPKFRTVMAYASGCSGCTSLPNFSNPKVNYSGIPMGIENSIDSARTLNYSAPYVAAWRQAVGPVCAYSLSPTSISTAAGSGSSSVTVTSTSGCAWAAISNASWITVSSGASGTGNGSVSLSFAANPNSTSRTGTVTVAGKTVTVTQAATACSYTLSATSLSTANTVGSGSVTVTSTSGCAWTAVSNASWITVTGGTSGSGNGTVAMSFALNPNTASRTGTVTIAGQTVTVTQAATACSYTLSATSLSTANTAGSGSVTVASTSGCAWTAVSNAAWITVSGGASGSGNGTVAMSFAANPNTASRTGTVTIAGQTVTVTQAATACSYTLSATSLSTANTAGSGSVTVTSTSGCAWTAVSGAAWITVSSGASGSGNGPVALSFAANPNTASRTGTVTIAGQTVTVTQAATPCNYTLSATSLSTANTAGSGSVTVSSTSGCAWTAVSGAAWITVSGGASGSGNGPVALSFASNPSTATRTGTVTIAGQTVTVTQAAAPCNYTLSATALSTANTGGSGAVNVVSTSECQWTAVSGAAWITVSGGASGAGNGTVSLSFASNPSTATRTGTVTIAGQTVTVTQAAAPCNYTLSATALSTANTGGSGAVNVVSTSECQWTAVSGAAWITVSGGGSGAGNGTVSLSFASNPSTATRTGTVTIAGQTVTVSQAAAPCNYTLSATALSTANTGGSGAVNVVSTSECQWTAVSGAAWITVSGGASGAGNGSVSLSFASNPEAVVRTGTVTIAGQTVTVSQAATPAPTPVVCDYSVNPTSLSAPSIGSSALVSVSSGETCNWTASSQSNWITLQGQASGTGSGSVSLTVAPNPNPTPRSGTVTVAGVAVSVSQEGVPVLPTLSLSQSKVLLAGRAGSGATAETTITVSSTEGSIPFRLAGALPSWLQVSASGASTQAVLQLRASVGSLSPGDYSTMVVVESGASKNATAALEVTFRVSQAVVLQAVPQALSFRLQEGTTQSQQNLQIRSSVKSTAIVVTTTHSPWLTYQSAISAQGWKMSVRVSTAGLAPGTYDAVFSASCPSGECDGVAIPVRLEVTASKAMGSQKNALISSGGVVSAASFEQGISEGSWMSVFGADLSPVNRMWELSDFDGNTMPQALDGVRIRVDGKPAAVHYVSDGQVNFQAPAGIQEGWVRLEVSGPFGSDEVFVYATRQAPGLFQYDSSGQIAALTQDGKPILRQSAGDGGTTNAARSGQVLSIFGTGFGPTDPIVEPGQIFSGAAPLVANGALQVKIGGVPAKVLFAGLSGAGLNQLNIVVPQLPAGDHEVELSIDGVPAQFGGKLAVQ